MPESLRDPAEELVRRILDLERDLRILRTQPAKILSKAGAPVDGDWVVAPPIGTVVYDKTNSRLYVRHAVATWKSVAVT